MNYKIVFFDVDGTITHHENGSISHKTKEAIYTLKNKGIKVVAATGRPLSLCNEIRELGIDTFITANGGYVKHNNEVIHKNTMDRKIIQDVFEFAQKEKDALSFYTEEFTMNGIENQNTIKALKETLSLNEYPGTTELTLIEEVFLMCLFANDESAEKYVSRFPDLTFRRWHPFVLNVLQEDISKSLAIKKTLEYFNIDKTEAAAFGDGENDIDMLEIAGLGIAMGNGNDKVKEIADYVTKKSSEDGIYFALKKYRII